MMSVKSRVGRWIVPMAVGALALGLSGCASNPSPSHVAQFWTQWDEDVVVQLAGAKPTIEIYNAGPGPIGRLDIISGDRTTSLAGIPPCGSSMFTLTDGAGVRIADSSGAQATIKIWSADGYGLVSEAMAQSASGN